MVLDPRSAETSTHAMHSKLAVSNLRPHQERCQLAGQALAWADMQQELCSMFVN